MITPITVGTASIVAVPKNRMRDKVRFQNVSATQVLYFTRQFGIIPNVPSATNYEVALFPTTVVFDPNEAFWETESTAQINVVASATGGSLAILETVKI